MPSETAAHYLRSHRKRLGLSQDELARLMGAASGAKVSQYERYSTEPSLRAVLACEFIFCVPARELFAGIFEAVQMVIDRSARELIEELERSSSDPRAAAKLGVLRAIVRSSERLRQNKRDA